MPSLTSHLLHLDRQALDAATTHPFLVRAATSALPTPKLTAWLAQDRLYQMSYISFVSSLLSHIHVPAALDRENSLEWRAADLLIDCLVNIRREVRMFEEVAEREGWLEDVCGDGVEASVQTRAYQDIFAGATAQGRPLVVGLVVLWATEECYLRAWRFAKSKIPKETSSGGGGGEEGEGKGDVMQRTFIPEWSSGEFEAFVRRIGGLVNKFGGYLEEGGFEWRECEIAWRQVLWAERNFWPEVD